jgi:biotin carboxylase
VAAEPDFIMPEGLICVGKYDAAKIAANRYIKQKGVVIKTNKGSGGNGVFIFRDGELPKDYAECEKKILGFFNGDRYWDEYPIVIEDLINSVPSTLGNLPNVEFKIHKNGRIEEMFVCDCQVTDKGVFYGLDINEDIINDRLQTRIEDTGYYIAEQYAAAGYRGQFDVDMIYARNGKIYVLESNTRNTGGTDTYKIVKKLAGKDFMDDVYTISRSRHGLLPKRKLTFQIVTQKLDTLLYSEKRGEGVIVSSENSIEEGKLIYVIVGKSKKRAYNLENELFRRFES